MISLCLITKNEEEWIGDFLGHLQPILEEIIVCDTGSSDRTKEIAREYGAYVVDIPWTDDFAKARNRSLDLATKPWILVLDPDIRVAKSELPKLLELTKNADAVSYEFIMRNYVRNPSLRDFQPCKGEFFKEERGLPGYFEDTRVALFRNDPGIRFEGIVHETVLNSVKDKILPAPIILHHYGLLPEYVEARKKRATYQRLSQLKVENNPNDWRAHLELGMEYLASHQFDLARESLSKANTLRPNDPFILKRLLTSQTRSSKTLDAIETARSLIEVEPENCDALLALSAGHILKSEYSEAEAILKRLLRIHPDSENGRMNLAILYSQQKRTGEAFELLNSLADRHATDPSFLKLTFEMALYSDHFEDAERFIRQYLRLVPGDAYAMGHLTTALMYQGKLNESLSEAQTILNQDPNHYLANFNAGVIYFERADWPAATRYLESALKAKPNDEFIMKALNQIKKEASVN